MSGGLVFLRTHEVSKLEAKYGPARVVAAQQRFIDAAFSRECELASDREDESQRSTGAVGISNATQIADVGLQIIVAPQAERGADADLIDDAVIALQENIRRDGEYSTAVGIGLACCEGGIAAIQDGVVS